jgi:hypothetical protein
MCRLDGLRQENASGGIAVGMDMEGFPGMEQPSDVWFRRRFTPASFVKSNGIREGQPGSAWAAFAGPMYRLPRDGGGVRQEHCRRSERELDARGLNGAWSTAGSGARREAAEAFEAGVAVAQAHLCGES